MGLASLKPDAPESLTDVFWAEWVLADDADDSDEANWRKVMPTLGMTDPPGAQLSLIRSEYQKAKRRGNMDVFRREYLGIWTRTPKEHRFDNDAWEACAADVRVTVGGTVAIDVAPDQSSAAIAIASAVSPTDVIAELLAEGPGSAWVVDKLKAIKKANPARIKRIVLDEKGRRFVCGRSEVQRFQRRGDRDVQARRLLGPVPSVGDRPWGWRCQPDDVLDAAVGSAGVRRLGEGSAWMRRGDAPIPGLVAITLASGAAAEDWAPLSLVM